MCGGFVILMYGIQFYVILMYGIQFYVILMYGIPFYVLLMYGIQFYARYMLNTFVVLLCGICRRLCPTMWYKFDIVVWYIFLG